MTLFRFPFMLAMVLCCLTAAPGRCFAADDLDDSRQELAQIKQRIDQVAAKLKQGRAQKSSLEKDLQGVNRQLTRLRAQEHRHAAGLNQLAAQIAGKEADIASLHQQSRQREGLVAKRLRALYRGGEMRLLRILFANRSPAATAEDLQLFKRIVRHDRRLLAEYRRDRELLGRDLAELESLRARRKRQIGQLQAGRKTLKEARRLKKSLVAKLKRQQGAMSEELSALKERRGRLAALVKRLESAPATKYTRSSGSFSQQKGLLSWPVAGRISIPFGKGRLPKLGTLYDSQGIEIEVSGNRAIHAVWGGRVIFANPFKGYGNMIIVDHGDNFYTLYAQASRLQKKVGDPVEVGELLGYPGYEDADSVYFEIRHRGTPLDPLVWLKPRP